jgi:hypothetical protein
LAVVLLPVPVVPVVPVPVVAWVWPMIMMMS